MTHPNPYTTLGVPRDATTEQVKRAYRKKAPKVHPDTSRHQDGKEFCALQKAYSILSDAERRARFDATGTTEDKPTPEEACRVSLGNMIVELVDSCPEDRITLVDVCAKLAGNLKLARETIELERRKKERSAEKFEKAAKRFKRRKKSKEPNFLELACLQQAAQSRLDIKNIEARLNLIDISSRLLQDFTYEFDSPPPRNYYSSLIDSLENNPTSLYERTAR